MDALLFCGNLFVAPTIHVSLVYKIDKIVKLGSKYKIVE